MTGPSTAATAVVPPVQTWAVAPLQLFSGEFLYYALVFLVLAIVAGLAGFRGIAGFSMGIARILVAIFLVLAVVALVL